MVNENITLMEFLKISRSVTEEYQKRGKIFENHNEAKILEEHEEFLNPTSPKNEIEEFWDSFWSKLTRLHTKDYSDEVIFDIGIWKWNVIHQKALEYKRSNVSNVVN